MALEILKDALVLPNEARPALVASLLDSLDPHVGEGPNRAAGHRDQRRVTDVEN
jgi:hypothetical protein